MQNTKTHKKHLGSYPYLNVLFSMSCALFLMGLVGLLALYAHRFGTQMRQEVEVQILLKDDIGEQGKNAVARTLFSSPYYNVERPMRFMTKESAARRLIAQTGEDFVGFLGENPLKDAFLMPVKPSEQDHMQQLATDMLNIPGVLDVVYTRSIVSQVTEAFERVGLTLGVLAAIFLVTGIALIHNAIRLALYSQRFLIRSMQLVGATPFFIKKPFLQRALLHGFLGGLLAALALLALQLGLWQALPELQAYSGWEDTALVLLSLLLAGALTGLLSAYWAVSRYLRLPLEALY